MSSTLLGCTAAYACEAAHALVLAESFLRVHPQARFTILLIDGPNDAITLDRPDVLYLSDLEIAQVDIGRLPMLGNSKELRTVFIPALLTTLLKRSVEPVVYFGERTWILAPITEVLESIKCDTALAATEKIENGLGDSGWSFIAARRGSEEALRHLSHQLIESLTRRGAGDDDLSQCLADNLDSLPHQTIAAPGFSLNYSNLDPASLTGAGRDYRYAGNRVLSFDFRGYDPGKPHLLSKYQGTEPRILLSRFPTVAAACEEYQQEVLNAGHARYAALPYRFESLPNGVRIDHRMRGLYRAAILESDATGKLAPPSPFGSGGPDKFVAWLNEPLTEGDKSVTRYMLAVREDREDVKNAFPDPLGTDAAAFRNWYRIFGRRELDLPWILMPGGEARAHEGEALIPAVNVAGYFRAELGLGVAARSIVSALEAAEVPFNTLNFGATANRQDHPFADRHAKDASVDINLVVVNPDQLPVFAQQTGPELRHGRYTIGVWFWEVEDFPAAYHGAFNYVDEIWVASDFMRETFLKVSPKPVFKYVLAIESPEIDSSLTRAALGWPRGFIFLFTLDLLSVLERKNPVGLIKAFTEAFPTPEGATLIIKTINGDKRLLEMEKLRYFARGRSDIILMDGYLSAVENRTLTALADCYVSLHRSEGFGLTIAEAMALGRPTIATAYSGNLEFMTANNSYLCPALRSHVGPDRDPYPKESFWSEPDISSAAGLLRHVYQNPQEALARGRRGADDLRAAHSAQRSGAIIRQQLTTIWHRRQGLAALGT